MGELEATWNRDGVLIFKDFMPAELIDNYCALRERSGVDLTGWGPVPYMYFDEIKEICLYAPLMRLLRRLTGTDMGLHLNLTGWISTERSWHQDDYLNPAHVNSWYLATWLALDDISPDSGPFEYIPGSHRWPLVRQSLVRKRLTKEERAGDWVKRSERILDGAFEQQIQESGLPVQQFLGRKGDLLVWHARLAHRGSPPRVPGTLRKAIISHYSALNRRRDMPHRKNWRGQGYYFHLNRPLINKNRMMQ